MKQMTCDVMIIGAGPAGTTAAAYLLQQGFKVIIVEKQKFPRYIIGESLLPRSMEQWDEVGFLDLLKAQNYNIKTGARFIRHDGVCNIDFSKKSFPGGWTWTWQVPRDHFDKLLADEVEKRGADILYESRVSKLSFQDHCSSVEIESGNGKTEIETRFIIDSSGFGNVVPGLLGYEISKSPDAKCAFYTLTQDTKKSRFAEADFISFEVPELDLWFWCIPFSDGRTSIGFVGDQKYFNDRSEEGFKQMIRKHLDFYKERFTDDIFCFPPYFHGTYTQTSTAPIYSDHYILVGNNLEFLDPVFSSGVALATESALRAAKLTARKLKGEQVDFQKEYVDIMAEGVDVFRSYVHDWYSGDLQTLFFSPNTNMQIKSEITSILAGYVWDKSNRLVVKHKTAVKNLAKFAHTNEKV